VANSGEKHIMKLGKTDGFRYIGIEPPLSREELADLPIPNISLGDIGHESRPSVELHDKTDGTMDLGFAEEVFRFGLSDEQFIAYANRIARHLGNTALDPAVRHIGPGSVIGQSRDVTPNY